MEKSFCSKFGPGRT